VAMMCGIERAFPETVRHVQNELIRDCRRNGIEVTMKAVNGVAFCFFVAVYFVANVVVRPLAGRVSIALALGGLLWRGAGHVRERILEEV